MTVYLKFSDIDAPVLLEGGSDLVDLIRRVLPECPFTLDTHAEDPPFFRIGAEKSGRYPCQNLITQGQPRHLDALNAVCDMVAAMSYAFVASQPAYLCLHAAAVDFAGRLVVLPNSRRAGKSTLTAVLAHRGHPVYTDDALPVRFDDAGRLVGRAGGVSPRLRLPLPDTMTSDFRGWVADNAGPHNRQYKYLNLPDLPPAGQEAPLGAIVILERDNAQPPSLTTLGPAEAMDALLFQNFTREVHSVDVLRLVARMVNTLPCMRMTYSEAQDAADTLESHFGEWSSDVPGDVDLVGALSRADFGTNGVVTTTASGLYRQKPGAALAEVGDVIYLADGDGAGIHRLNPVSQAIWTLLEHPISPYQIRDTLSGVFPETDPKRIEADVMDFLARLASAGLISSA